MIPLNSEIAEKYYKIKTGKGVKRRRKKKTLEKYDASPDCSPLQNHHKRLRLDAVDE
jgi:hypothetical protein